ncbi:MAG: hypothetical protein KatS3mg113_0815 [Planctomycetaceae bacterium]|nr:MAG: hypothetical protein KatS3mg113_0815 [Planctomycetaceae bacterium]
MPIPDFTTLAKRAGKLDIALEIRRHRGPIDVVVDSTGLKVFGEGELKMRQHGKGKRRTWRRVHLAVNPQTQEIVAPTLTDNSSDDAGQVDPLLDQAPKKVRKLYGDGAYDQQKVYDTWQRRGVVAIIPHRRNARIQRHGNYAGVGLARDMAIRQIRDLGRRRSKERVGYHRRSLSETAIYRMKCSFGGCLKNPRLGNQQTEVRLRSKILNTSPTSASLSSSGVSQQGHCGVFLPEISLTAWE